MNLELESKLSERLDNAKQTKLLMKYSYLGEYDNLEDYAKTWAMSYPCHSALDNYIDYKTLARDLSHALIEIKLDSKLHLFLK